MSSNNKNTIFVLTLASVSVGLLLISSSFDRASRPILIVDEARPDAQAVSKNVQDAFERASSIQADTRLPSPSDVAIPTKQWPLSLLEFQHINAKALPSKIEQEKMRALLNSRQTYSDVVAVLIVPHARFSIEMEKQHLAATALLEKALAREDGTSRDLALVAIEQIIFSSVPDVPEQARQVYIEDKAELIHYALSTKPELVRNYLSRAQENSLVSQLLQNVIDYNRNTRTASSYLTESLLDTED